MTKRCALYLRVSTDKQSTDNQRRELEAVAAQRGWTIVAVYEDAGISGAKARDRRPGLDKMLKDAARGQFQVCMAWALDRLGRSVPDLYSTMQELRGAHVDLFLHQQGLDTTTDMGRAMYGMLAVFADFERSMIQTRVQAGVDRVRATGITKSGRPIGRPAISERKIEAICQARLDGMSLRAIAQEHDIGHGTVHRIIQDNTRLGTLGR